MVAFARRRVVVSFLRVVWVLIIFWHEHGIFISNARGCSWPDTGLLAKTNETTNARPQHVLLVADPQIVDQHSYPSRGPLGSYLTRLVVDLNLRKNWQAALHKRPDIVVFLGDMMDNGRLDVSDEEYEHLFTRFSDIFRLDPSIPQYFIPGNHDTGLGKSSTFSPHAFSRYISHFGPTNIEISVANHTLVLFDAPGYANEDSKRHGAKKAFTTWIPIQGGSLEYMKKFARDKHKDPVILFTHIPLYRPDGKNCGPLREKGTLRPGVGHGYQNTLEKQSSLRLLEALKPVAIFSGDDHDYCEYTHQLRPTFGPPINILETTVKSISMVMNVRKPGFQLLSLAPADLRRHEGPSYADTLCLLPDQLRIYLNIYLPLLAISIIVVFFSNLNRGKRRGHSKEFSDAHLLLSTSKVEGDDDDDDDTELNPYLSSSSHGLPPPISSINQKSPRSSRSAGWFVIQAPGREAEGAGGASCECVQNALHLFWSGRTRSASHRRGWFGSSIRDVRDIAVFPLGLFVVITWWVSTR